MRTVSPENINAADSGTELKTQEKIFQYLDTRINSPSFVALS